MQKSGTVRAFTGELTEAQSKKNAELRNLMGVIGQRSGGKVKYFLAENTGENGFFDPDTGVVAIDVSTLESGKAVEQLVKGEIAAELWQKTAIHETDHATEGTAAHALLTDHLASNDSVYNKAVEDFLARGYFGADADAARARFDALIEKLDSGETLTDAEDADLGKAQSEIAAENVLGNADFVKHLVKGEPSRAEKILGKIVQIKNALSGEKGRAANREIAFVQKAERLYLNAIAELGGTYRDGKIHLANREEEKEGEGIDESGEVGYNDSEVKFSLKRERYISYNKLGKGIEDAIRSRLYELYRGVKSGIANDIAVEIGDTVYIVDSGKENGKIPFGVKEIIVIDDANVRQQVREDINDRAVSNGIVSDALSEKIGRASDQYRASGFERELQEKLSTDSRKPQDQQRGVLDSDGNRGVGGTQIDFTDAIDQSAGAFDSWAQAVSDDSEGEGRYLPDFENRRGEMGVDDIYEGEQERNHTRDQGRSEQNYQIDLKEVDELVAKLKAMVDTPIAEVVIDDAIRDLNDSEEINKRLREMIEAESKVKQGQGSELEFSRTVKTDGQVTTDSGFVGSYTGTKYNATQAKLLAGLSLEGIQNATDLAGRQSFGFNQIGISDPKTQQAWIDAGLAYIDTNADGDEIIIVNDAMLMDERERRQKKGKTDGQAAKDHADRNYGKICTKKDAREIISAALTEHLTFADEGVFGNLVGKSRTEAIEVLWRGLNSAEEGQRAGLALDMADFIIENAVAEDLYDDGDNTEQLERLKILRGYMHKLDLSSIKGEIEHKLGKKNTAVLVWGARKNTRGLAVDVAAMELAERGVKLNILTAIKVLHLDTRCFFCYT